MTTLTRRRIVLRSASGLLATAMAAAAVFAGAPTTEPVTLPATGPATTAPAWPAPIEAAPDAPPPDYTAYHQSYHIPYAPVGPKKTLPDFDHLTGMNVRASINGGPIRTFQVDTGSWGIVVGDEDVPNIDPNAPAGDLTYSSSGNGFFGVWTMATVTFPDSTDGHGNVATATVPVLAANMYKFTPGAVNGGGKRAATQRAHPHPYMFGIGSGRGPENNQFRNPWLNLKEMQAGTMRRGYTLTRDGITLGLTKDTVGDGYVYEKLREHVGKPTTWPAIEPRPKDWNASTGYVTVDGKKQELSWMLLDTGLTNMMLEFPEMHGQAPVANDTPIRVDLLGGKLHYGFKVGDKTDPTTPLKVTWTHHDAPAMINTGLKALSIFDYLYDADGGYCGLRPTAKHE